MGPLRAVAPAGSDSERAPRANGELPGATVAPPENVKAGEDSKSPPGASVYRALSPHVPNTGLNACGAQPATTAVLLAACAAGATTVSAAHATTSRRARREYVRRSMESIPDVINILSI